MISFLAHFRNTKHDYGCCTQPNHVVVFFLSLKFCVCTDYGPKYENGEWKSRTNRELEEMNKGENIVKRIKGRRISWLGHLERMEEDRMPKKIFTQNWKGREEGEDPGKDGKRK